MGPVMNESMWRLSFGRIGIGPYGQAKPTDRPTHIETIIFHSLEAALKYPSRGLWWEITSPVGLVVVSSYKGFDEEACSDLPLSLCARQILNAQYIGSFPDAEVEEVWFDSASHDDGVTWEPVLLGVKNSSAARNGHQKPEAPRPLTVLSIEPCTDPPNSVTIHHTSGRVTIRYDRLEIKETAKGAYHLTILDPESGHAKGIYGLIDFDAVIMAHLLGVKLTGKNTKEEKGDNSRGCLPKTWKPGLFKRAQADGPPINTRGHIRGSLAIDRRVADVTGGYADPYQRLLWHLTHIPTGLLIVQGRHRRDVEEIANALREEVPELTDGDRDGGDVVVDAEIKRRVRAVVDQFRGAS